jgi:hypothetical protein
VAATRLKQGMLHVRRVTKARRYKGGVKEAISDYVPEGAEAVVFMTHKAGKKSAQKTGSGAVTGKGKRTRGNSLRSGLRDSKTGWWERAVAMQGNGCD